MKNREFIRVQLIKGQILQIDEMTTHNALKAMPETVYNELVKKLESINSYLKMTNKYE